MLATYMQFKAIESLLNIKMIEETNKDIEKLNRLLGELKAHKRNINDKRSN